MKGLYTIGHSRHTMEYFISLLKKYNINYLLDVRSIPYSSHAEQFNKENIMAALKTAGINYSPMGNYFGARPVEKELYNREGYLDFEKVAKSVRFNKGMDNVILGLHRGNRIALMCTEKDPIDCHRAIMVARAFDVRGIKVSHILPNGSILTQRGLDDRLLEMFFPDRGQISFFDDISDTSDTELIIQAYRKRNEQIGYRISSGKTDTVIV